MVKLFKYIVINIFLTYYWNSGVFSFFLLLLTGKCNVMSFRLIASLTEFSPHKVDVTAHVL